LAFCSLRLPILANYILPLKWALCEKEILRMALFSISLGAVFFLISIAWIGFVALSSQVENSGLAFGFILGVFPALLGMLFIVPSSLYRAIFVFTQKPKQTVKDKVTLITGLLITFLYGDIVIKLIFT
jgi:hypothetical protein